MFGILEINRNTIIKDGDPVLRLECNDETFPLSDYKKDIIKKIRTYLKESNIPEIAEEKNLEPSIGLAAPQIGMNTNICAVYLQEDEDMPELDLILINPKIINKSEKMIYLEGGEGCLSIPNKKDGYVHRNDEIEVEYFDVDGTKKNLKANGLLSIALQHEIDHLSGILYTDHIDKKNPFKVIKNSEPLI